MTVTKKKPVIGVIPLFDEEKDSIWMVPGYMEGIREAGGIPVILPLTGDEADFLQLDEGIDGYLFTGGHDVSPEIYGAEKSPLCGALCPEREQIEKYYYDRAVAFNKPVFGICRGIQLINALEGGTLYQDLPAEYAGTNSDGEKTEHHMSAPYDRTIHKVTLVKDSPLFALLGCEELPVNSYHHQAVKELAPGLKSMAVSEDGLIEAIYRPDRKFIWAVQWHPEFIYKKDETCAMLFRKFVEACSN